MNLYLLKRIEPADWDQTEALVVRAETPTEARALVVAECRYEDGGPGAWLGPLKTTCDLLTPDGKPGVIVQDYKSS